MKEVLSLMARYNKEANRGMTDCFLKTGDTKLKKDIGIYYKSAWGCFEHCLGGDMTMFGSVFRMYCVRPEAHDNPIFSYGGFTGLHPQAGENIEDIIATRSKVDELVVNMVADMTDLEKIETLKLPGVTFEKPRYQMVMGMFTHSTHHRGQIAAALDILGVDNDFNGLLSIK